MIEKTTFALFRLPDEKEIRVVAQEDNKPLLLDNIEALNGQRGFVIAPFRITPQTPIVLIKGKIGYLECESFGRLPDADDYETNEAIAADYEDRFITFMQPLLTGKLNKVVLSRKEELRIHYHFSSMSSFFKACERYPHSYIYMVYTPQTGTWMGCTPELLLAGKATQWQTVAMAGTQQLAGGNLPTNWDEKNSNEQRIVAQYIKEQLQSIGIEAREEGPYTVPAAQLAHLKSDFRFALPNPDRLGDLLALLHPTPAVCGWPKEEARQFIIENEGYNRRYYSGFVGLLDPEGNTNLYVNLRCMQILDNKLRLYAGGGLLASSTLEEEWQETEDKLGTMKRII